MRLPGMGVRSARDYAARDIGGMFHSFLGTVTCVDCNWAGSITCKFESEIKFRS